jgi:6-phosphogluconolactonase
LIKRKIRVFDNLSEVQFVELGLHKIRDLANNAITRRGYFHIALAGGETPRRLYQSLRRVQTDWKCWHFWFSDERCLPSGDKNLNYTMIWEELLSFIDFNPDNVHPICGFKGPMQAAREYNQTIKDTPTFDIALLGLGEDGHTASLFPDNEAAEIVCGDTIAIQNAPKLPAERVSLSSQRLCRSECIIFLVSGEVKRDIVRDFIEGKPMPSTKINGQAETVLLYNPHG